MLEANVCLPASQCLAVLSGKLFSETVKGHSISCDLHIWTQVRWLPPSDMSWQVTADTWAHWKGAGLLPGNSFILPLSRTAVMHGFVIGSTSYSCSYIPISCCLPDSTREAKELCKHPSRPGDQSKDFFAAVAAGSSQLSVCLPCSYFQRTWRVEMKYILEM